MTINAAHGPCPAWCRGHYETLHLGPGHEIGPLTVELSADSGSAPVVSVLPTGGDRPLTITEAEGLGRALLELASAARRTA